MRNYCRFASGKMNWIFSRDECNQEAQMLFSHNTGCQKCPNICQTVTAVSWTSIASKTWPFWIIPPAEGILGLWVSYWQYPWRTDLVTRKKKKLLSSLRTIFMLISGCTTDFYKIFNTVGKITLLSSAIWMSSNLEEGRPLSGSYRCFIVPSVPGQCVNQIKINHNRASEKVILFPALNMHVYARLWKRQSENRERERGKDIFVRYYINLDLWPLIN